MEKKQKKTWKNLSAYDGRGSFDRIYVETIESGLRGFYYQVVVVCLLFTRHSFTIRNIRLMFAKKQSHQLKVVVFQKEKRKFSCKRSSLSAALPVTKWKQIVFGLVEGFRSLN